MSKKRLKLAKFWNQIRIMPQKTQKNVKSSAKKPTKKSSGTSKKTAKRRIKPKVFIPAYKIIIFCAVIITICMSLLLVTTFPNLLQKENVFNVERKVEKQAENTERQDEKVKKNDAKIESSEKKEEQKIKTQPKQESQPQLEPQSKPKQQKRQEKSPKQKKDKKLEKKPEQKEPSLKVTSLPPKSNYDFPQAENGAQLIFVFDDGGHSVTNLNKFLELPFPITVAVLPKLVLSKVSAEKIRASGNELMLHQPMQAVNPKVNPGPGAIKPEMSDDEVKSILFQNVSEIGPIAGFNNHEGSAITADAEKMAVIMKFASQEGIYFLDSRTSAETKVPYVASEMGYSYFERNIFLDNEKTDEYALEELKKGLAIANKNGSVIMIGHVWSADFLPSLLKDVYPKLKEKGYTFSVVSKSKARKH